MPEVKQLVDTDPHLPGSTSSGIDRLLPTPGRSSALEKGKHNSWTRVLCVDIGKAQGRHWNRGKGRDQGRRGHVPSRQSELCVACLRGNPMVDLDIGLMDRLNLAQSIKLQQRGAGVRRQEPPVWTWNRGNSCCYVIGGWGVAISRSFATRGVILGDGGWKAGEEIALQN